MALAENTPLKIEHGDYNELPVAAAVRVYEGAMVGQNSSGYARGLVSLDTFVGHAMAEANNTSGSNGDIRVKVLRGTYYLQVTLASVAVTDIGAAVFATADGTLTLTPSGSKVGRVHRYVTTNTAVVQFTALGGVSEPTLGQPVVYEFDCETGVDADYHTLLPAASNPYGCRVLMIYGVITEAFAGGDEDQGVVTVKDGSDNTLTTITVANATGDAVGDIRFGYNAFAATAGDAGKSVAANVLIKAAVTTPTAGAAVAGKMKVYMVLQPLASS